MSTKASALAQARAGKAGVAKKVGGASKTGASFSKGAASKLKSRSATAKVGKLNVGAAGWVK